MARLMNELEKDQAEIAKVEYKRDNPAFKQKVTVNVLAEHKKRLQEWQTKRDRLLELLGGLENGQFFFSSRRRHTISKRDWSSDVCSSDLLRPAREPRGPSRSVRPLRRRLSSVQPDSRDPAHPPQRFRDGPRGSRAGRSRSRVHHDRKRSEERRVGQAGTTRWARRASSEEH